jgi:hypothetical protein
MIETLLRVVGIDIKRLAREAAITIVIATMGGFAAILALAIGFVGLYLWLEIKIGTSAALCILGGTSALLAIILLVVALRRTRGKSRARAEDTLPAVPDPVQLSTLPIVRAAQEAINVAVDKVRKGSRQQIAGAIAVAALIGWLLGRRS